VIFRRALIFGISSAASRLAAIALVPVYVRSMSVQQYGDLELLLAVGALMVLIGGLQSESAVLRDHSDLSATGHSHAYAWCALLVSIGGCFATCGIMVAAAALSWLPASVVDGRVFWPLLALTLPSQVLGVQLTLLRCSGSPWAFALLSFGDLVLGLILSIVFVGMLEMGVPGALLGLLVGKVIAVTLAWPWTFGWPSAEWGEGPLLMRMLRYGIPAIPAVVVGWMQTAGIRVALAVCLEMRDVAVASVAMKVAAIYGLAVFSFRMAWEPHAMSRLSNRDVDPSQFRREASCYVVVMFLVAGAAIVAAPLVTLALGTHEYCAAGPLACLFIAGQFWAGLQSITSMGIHGSRRTGLLFPVASCAAIVNIASLLALAPWIGVYGAGVGFFLSSVVGVCLSAHFSNRSYSTRFDPVLLGWALLVTASFATGWILLLVRFPAAKSEPWPMLGSIAFGVASLGFATAILTWFGPCRTDLRDGLRVFRASIMRSAVDR
jgi:O-antigen/teichoic acid export membrane protein